MLWTCQCMSVFRVAQNLLYKVVAVLQISWVEDIINLLYCTISINSLRMHLRGLKFQPSATSNQPFSFCQSHQLYSGIKANQLNLIAYIDTIALRMPI